MEEPSPHNGAPGKKEENAPQNRNDQSTLEVRSAEVQEIIGRPPHWLVRGGIAAFLAVLVIVFAMASAIEYPEAVDAGIVLKMEGNAATITAQSEGILTRLSVENGVRVQRGQLLGEMIINEKSADPVPLTAPRASTLFYMGILEEGQQIADSLGLFYIRPDSATYYGELMIPETAFGKIEEGQVVLARFNGYPSQEYGSVKAQIDYFSEVMVAEGMFVAKASFPEGLSTNYGYQLTPVDGMRGQAEILTQDLKLLDRIYNNITEKLR